MVQALQERPPYVTFETRPIEDRDGSIASGHYVGKDVDYAFITPAGSKDRIERVVSEWFVQLKVDVASERLPAAWLLHYEALYRDFKAGDTVKPNGVPIRDWPGLSPSMVKLLQSLQLFAIEDVAAANEETIGRMGMGGRALKQRAIDYLSASENVGKVAEAASSLRAEVESLRATVAKQAEDNAALMKQVQAFLSAQTQVAQQGYQMPAAAETVSADDLGLGDKL